MNAHAGRAQKDKSHSVANENSRAQNGGESTFQLVNNRSETVMHKKLQEMANNCTQAQQATLLQFSAGGNNDVRFENEADVMGINKIQPPIGHTKFMPQSSKTNKIIQLKQSINGHSPEQAELLGLADELHRNKSDIHSASDGEIDLAISNIRNAVELADHNSLLTLLTELRKLVNNADREEVTSGALQFASRASKGAIIGSLLGSIVPVIGNIIGGVIGYKRGKRKDLHQLTLDGATPLEIQTMMAIEPSAYRIHTQIMAEATQSPTRINQLYVDGATSAEITKILAVDNDAQTIHHNLTNVVAGVTLPDLLYSTNSNGNVGSIYFTDGRVRLVHDHGPMVDMSPGVQRFVITQAESNSWLAGHINLVDLLPRPLALAGQAGILGEIYPPPPPSPDNEHVSRGGPVAFNYGLALRHLNIIANVAQDGNNDTLRSWMGAFPPLAAIPMN